MSGLKLRINTIVSSGNSSDKKLEKICHLLRDEVPHYNWVGFYFKNGNKEELKLGPFSGEPTEHIIIPYGKGICGQTAVSGKTFVVQDVSEQDNYLACSVETQSEIVVPIFKDGENIGQIDIDSHDKHPFTDKDEELLNYVCEKVSEFI